MFTDPSITSYIITLVLTKFITKLI